MDKAKEREIKKIRKLMKDILNWKRLYYSGNAVISDGVYDAYERQLEAMDPQNPVIQMVGYSPDYVVPRGYMPGPKLLRIK